MPAQCPQKTECKTVPTQQPLQFSTGRPVRPHKGRARKLLAGHEERVRDLRNQFVSNPCLVEDKRDVSRRGRAAEDHGVRAQLLDGKLSIPIHPVQVLKPDFPARKGKKKRFLPCTRKILRTLFRTSPALFHQLTHFRSQFLRRSPPESSVNRSAPAASRRSLRFPRTAARRAEHGAF